MKKTVLVSALLIAGCAAPQKAPPVAAVDATTPGGMLLEGVRLLNDGQRKRALEEFDRAIARCEQLFAAQAPDKKIYASRGKQETIFYLGQAAAAHETAVVVESTCADALYMRGYAGLDSGQLELAEEHLDRAVAMSPMNALYLSEQGHIRHLKREWERALQAFSDAEKAAALYTPPELKDLELARAKRGIGYSLIELGRLDEAEAKFKECLKIDRRDKNALHELEYIKGLRGDAAD